MCARAVIFTKSIMLTVRFSGTQNVYKHCSVTWVECCFAPNQSSQIFLSHVMLNVAKQLSVNIWSVVKIQVALYVAILNCGTSLLLLHNGTVWPLEARGSYKKIQKLRLITYRKYGVSPLKDLLLNTVWGNNRFWLSLVYFTTQIGNVDKIPTIRCYEP
jgi:hypothetical protein